MIPITSFQVTGLHKSRTVTIPINENRLIVVGVNGLGKTTIVNLLYCFLSRQWRRLLQYEFGSIAMTIGDRTLALSKEEIETGLHSMRRRGALLSRHVSHSVMDRLERYPEIEEILRSGNLGTESAMQIAEIAGLPQSIVRRLIDSLSQESLDGLLDEVKAWRSVEEFLKTKLSGQILYLPTYRRIEKDLKAIFPELEEHIRKFNQQKSNAVRGGNFIELVEFGMEDVDAQFKQILTDLKETARSELNTLAGSYLRDVIRGEAEDYEEAVINALDDDTVTRILNRVEEKTLNESDKHQLRNAIARLKNMSGTKPSAPDRFIGHFFSKLVEIHSALTKKEEAIVRFVEVCKHYLSGKELVFNDKSYQLEVRLTDGSPLSLKDLSSGEKQVVSLFSHVYLGGNAEELIVIIDEPELSLSVEWQRLLLPDIMGSGRCGFLTAVTHSPFIFDNELNDYAQDLARFVSTEK